MKPKRKHGGGDFLVQGSILAVASIVAKVIGLIYRVPLTNILGDSGNSYYSTANEIYTLILMISSFSLPLAISRMMAERISRGEYRNANRVFQCAMRFAVIGGGAAALITYVFSGLLTKYVMNFELAKYGLRVIAPAILIFAITGTFRGYFQGFGTMVPTAASQVIEQIVNAIISIVCAGIMFRYGAALAAEQGNELLGPAWGAAGATFGTVASVTVAMLFMMVMYIRKRREMDVYIRDDVSSKRESSRIIYRVLMLTVLPIVFSTLVYNLSNVIDQGIFNAVLKGKGYTEAQYSVIWGIYAGKFRVLMNVVLSLASSLGPAIVPSMTGLTARDRKTRREACNKVGSAIRFTMIFSIPGALGLAALGGPVIVMLFHPQTGVPLSAGILQAGAPMIILYALSTLTTSILQGLGKLKEPLIHCCIALVIHIGALYMMLNRFGLNIYAVIHANTIFALIVTILNAFAISRMLGYRQEILRSFVIPAAASAIMAFAAFGIYSLLHLVFGVSVSTVFAILAGVFIYSVSLVALGGISSVEILSLPKGRHILNFFKRLGLVR